MFGNFLRKAGSGTGRVFGVVGDTLRRFGETGAKAVRGIGNFVISNHQPIAMLARGVGEATGNEKIKQLANMGMAGSAYLTTKGVGNDYTGLRRMMGYG